MQKYAKEIDKKGLKVHDFSTILNPANVFNGSKMYIESYQLLAVKYEKFHDKRTRSTHKVNNKETLYTL